MISNAPRVLQIGKHFYPDNGGIEAVTLAISEMLAVHRIKADVLATTASSKPYHELSLSYEVIRCRPIIRLGTKNISLSYVNAVRRLEAAYDLAIVHMPNPVAAAAVLACWHKPLILFWHADIPYELPRQLLRPLDSRLARRADAIVALTPVHLRESVLADLLVPRGVVIGYPVDRSWMRVPTEITPAGRRARSFLAGRKLILAVGRLVPYKGFDVLIEAACTFPPGLAAIIVGDGPRRDKLQAAIDAAKLGNRVLLMGSIGRQELNDLFDLAYIGCMPSLTAQEMYGIVQAEFMAFGKPVISTRLVKSGVPWINRDGQTGILVQPGSASELAQAVDRFFNEEQLYDRLSVGACSAFAKRNDQHVIGEKWNILVRSIASGKGIPESLGMQNEDLA